MNIEHSKQDNRVRKKRRKLFVYALATAFVDFFVGFVCFLANDPVIDT
jgi:hypothetical protein